MWGAGVFYAMRFGLQGVGFEGLGCRNSGFRVRGFEVIWNLAG